jgi:hypothetical protein
MERTVQAHVVAAAMAVFAFTGGAAGAVEGEGLVVVLHVTDLARTGSTRFGRAKDEATRVFEDIGVRLVWTDIAEGPEAHACDGLNLSVSLLSPSLVRTLTRGGIDERALGSAWPSEGFALIFSERVTERAARSRIDGGVLLGRVIAHEVGHLLLPKLRHSKVGLMTARVSTDALTWKSRFHKPEPGEIRARLRARIGPDVGHECGQGVATAR